jgi:uncharacterized membrane protein
MQTLVDVFIAYNPPAGALGDAGEKLGAGSRFEKALQQDLDNFARMVDQAPATFSTVAVRLLKVQPPAGRRKQCEERITK